jgi:hypothetical protein
MKALEIQKNSNKELTDTLAHERNSFTRKFKDLRQEHDSNVERIKARQNAELERRTAKYKERTAELERQYALNLRKCDDKWRLEFGSLAKRIVDDSNRFSESEAAVAVTIESLSRRLLNLKSIVSVISVAVKKDKKFSDALRVR